MSEDTMQLDIFEHSREVMLRNAVVAALLGRDAAAAARAIAVLRLEYPDDAILSAFGRLQERLGVRVSGPLGRSAAGDVARATELAEPVAREVLGREADAWLAPFWAELAAGIATLPFDSTQEDLHAAPMLLRAGRWEQARDCARAIESWRRQPAPLAWMLVATARIGAMDAVWPHLAELAWMAPQRAAAVAGTLGAELQALVREFDRDFEDEGDDAAFAWFPAWLLVAHPGLAGHLRGAQAGAGSSPERCARLLLHLLALERQGRHDDLVDGRRSLRGAHPGLFARYMRSRQG